MAEPDASTEREPEAEPLQPKNITLLPIQEKPADQPSTRKDYDPCLNAKPYSPFYRHATPSSRLTRLTSHSSRKRSRSLGLSPIDDIEGQGCPPWQRLRGDERSANIPGSESRTTLWVQEKRNCDCLAALSKGQRIAVKVAIAVVIVGSMVAVALGITAAVGGGVWKSNHQQGRID
ncbi:hypothetical protein BJX99DRAFT_257880 [Aspergillus californicus]